MLVKASSSLIKNLHNIAGIGGFALQRFVKQCMHCCPCQIGVAGFFAAAGFIGRAVATGGGGATDCHKGLRYVGVSGVKLQTAVADNVVGLEYQGVLTLGL